MSDTRAAEPASGPRVARLFHRLLALTFLVAWLSLGAQIAVLVGSRGLLPAHDLTHLVAARPDLGTLDAPTLFRFGVSDALLANGVALGVALSVLALLGIVPRLCLAAGTVLYLSYAVVCSDFLGFQWDNLLLECGALAVFLPRHDRAPWVHFLLRVLLFKLYFESGVAKYEAASGCWTDGTAMRVYYETAPIPTWVAWYAHHLPPSVHALESWGALGFELVVPFLIFAGRRGRLVASVVFAGFQTLNIATANYGFFSTLALVLQVMLLSDSDVERAASFVRRAWRLPPRFPRRALRRGRALARLARRAASRRWASVARLARADRHSGGAVSASSDDARTLAFVGRLSVAVIVTLTYLGVSLDGALAAFAPGLRMESLASLSSPFRPLRVVNTYHLFGDITTERIEPTFETFDGMRWTAHDLRYKPGDPSRPPPFVAPHQPRVDFLLWFYGLSHDRGMPLYVRNLVTRLCSDPSAVAPLFVDALPSRPAAARVSFYRYHFSSSAERALTHAWWTREPVSGERTLRCTP